MLNYPHECNFQISFEQSSDEIYLEQENEVNVPVTRRTRDTTVKNRDIRSNWPFWDLLIDLTGRQLTSQHSLCFKVLQLPPTMSSVPVIDISPLSKSKWFSCYLMSDQTESLYDICKYCLSKLIRSTGGRVERELSFFCTDFAFSLVQMRKGLMNSRRDCDVSFCN